MADTLVAESAADTADGPMFGILDIFLMGVSLAFGVYWFFLRDWLSNDKNKKEEYRPLNVPTPDRDTSTGGFIKRMKSSHKNVVVFYGSQTGTAEEFAGRLSKDAQRFGLKGMISDPEECEMEQLAELPEIDNSLAIFCMATYGEGDPTDNAQEFYDWLQEGATQLDGVKYAVFGLGNKTYEHYNEMGKFVDKKLEELGAERIFELGMGDDDGNMEEDFVTWREKFWPAVCEHFGLEATGDDSSIRQYTLEIVENKPPEEIFTGEVGKLGSFKTQKPKFDHKNPYLAPVKMNRELHTGGDRSCMHIEFDISDGTDLRYEAGDHVAVYPVNDQELVDKLGKLLNADLDTVISLNNVDEEASKKHPFPCPCTYRTAFSHYIDITAPPRTNVLKDISDYAEDPKDKEFLLKISSPTPEGKHEYHNWIIEDHRNIVAILEDLPSVKPPTDHLCELLPRLQARYYSISSSPKEYPDSIHITAVLTKYTTRTGRIANGVATSWLKQKVPNGPQSIPTVPIFVRHSQFRLPLQASTPVIMIGPGTGVAPFRGFIQERHHAKTQGKELGDTILFFGCRKEKEDYIYHDELENYKITGVLSKLFVAFSRDQEKKVYVQDLLREQKQILWEVLEKEGHIYVCGDARHMAHDVQQTIHDIICQEGGKSVTESDDYIKKMHSKGRYACDVWS